MYTNNIALMHVFSPQTSQVAPWIQQNKTPPYEISGIFKDILDIVAQKYKYW